MRSSWKGLFYSPSIQRSSFIEKFRKNPFFKLYQRFSFVPSFLKGAKLSVYTGKKFVSARVRSEMVGHRFGEFFFTKKMSSTIHQKSKSKKKVKKLG